MILQQKCLGPHPDVFIQSAKHLDVEKATGHSDALWLEVPPEVLLW